MRTDNLKRKCYRVIYISKTNRFKTVSHDVWGYSTQEAKVYGIKLLNGRTDYFIHQIVEIRD